MPFLLPLVCWEVVYLRRRASRSDSSRQRMSSSRTVKRVGVSQCGPLLSGLQAHFSPKHGPARPVWLGGMDGFRSHGAGDSPGPLTLRMMERVWSSMNSTRTWVTPPREPIPPVSALFLPCHSSPRIIVWFVVVRVVADGAGACAYRCGQGHG